MTTHLHRPAGSVDSALIRSLANTIRGLTIDATNRANSGHPGLPLGAADMATTLWYYFLRVNPDRPHWVGRDKFILSAGHGSMLIYSLLHLAGYDLSLDDLKNFRQWDSKTPGHPEVQDVPGIEVTTGPLGQGFANGVGMALADRMLGARVNSDVWKPIDNFVYAVVSDGDLMEGVALEAASFAAHHKLGNLIYLYDDNDITLDGPTTLSFEGEDTPKKFEAIGWHVLTVDGHDPQAVADAIVASQDVTDKPSLICCRTIIGYGSPNKAGSSGAHGSPLGVEEGKLAKEKLGISLEEFHVPDADRAAWQARKTQLLAYYENWNLKLEGARSAAPKTVATLEAHYAQELPADLSSKLPKFDKPIATRKAGQAVLKAIAPELPWLVGGSADLSVSTAATIDTDGKVSAENLLGRHLFFGVREHAMGAIVNGMVRHGAFRAFGATFLTFSDYMRGSIRLSALMECPAIHVFTHDSVFLGEDGPTHQPVEHVMALRTIPGLNVFRPDVSEVGEAWIAALAETHAPSVIILTRQNLPAYDKDSDEFKGQGSAARGGYVFRPEKNAEKLDAILLGTGSEVQLCVEAARVLEAEGLSVRVVSLPCWEIFDKQPASYREEVLPSSVTKRVSVEAGITLGWSKFLGFEGTAVGIDHFGKSAPDSVLAEKFGFTTERVAKEVRSLLG